MLLVIRMHRHAPTLAVNKIGRQQDWETHGGFAWSGVSRCSMTHGSGAIAAAVPNRVSLPMLDFEDWRFAPDLRKRRMVGGEQEMLLILRGARVASAVVAGGWGWLPRKVISCRAS